MSFFLSPSGWIFPLRRGSSSSVLILPGLLRSDQGGLSVSSPSGEWEDACGLRRWCKFPALEFYSASFLHWIFLLSYPHSITHYIFDEYLNRSPTRSPTPSLLRIPWISRGWTPALKRDMWRKTLIFIFLRTRTLLLKPDHFPRPKLSLLAFLGLDLFQECKYIWDRWWLQPLVDNTSLRIEK